MFVPKWLQRNGYLNLIRIISETGKGSIARTRTSVSGRPESDLLR